MVLVTQGWALDTKVNISGLHVIDIDGDGTQEIIVSAGDKNIFIKNGSIIKTEKPKYPQEYIAHVDIDHDGRVEKIYVERGILYYEKDNKVMWKYEFGKKIKQIVLGDADADKSNEIIVLTEDETLAYLKTYGKKIWEKNIPGLFKCEVGDVNGDGTDELIVASKTCIYVIRVGIIVQKISGREILDISIGDVNGDGIKELIVAEKKRYLVIDMRKTEVEQGKANIIGTNVFQKEEILQIDVVDIDRDMKAEVIVLLKDRIDAYRLKNELVFKADIKSPGFIVHGDINGDTVNELVVVFSKRYVVSFELLLSGPRLFKFAEILSSSEKILIDDICHAVGIGRDELFEFLLLWSGIINYRIEGEYIVKIKRVTERVEIQNINGMIILSTPRRKILYDTLLSTLATRFIFLMLKESGVHIFNLTLGHKLENPELLAGLITALRSLGSEVGFSNTGKVRQFFEHGFQILMVDGDYTTLVLLMKRKPDEQFMENALRSVNEIEKTYQEKLKNFSGTVGEFEGIRKILEEWLMIDLNYPHKLKENVPEDKDALELYNFIKRNMAERGEDVVFLEEIVLSYITEQPLLRYIDVLATLLYLRNNEFMVPQFVEAQIKEPKKAMGEEVISLEQEVSTIESAPSEQEVAPKLPPVTVPTPEAKKKSRKVKKEQSPKEISKESIDASTKIVHEEENKSVENELITDKEHVSSAPNSDDKLDVDEEKIVADNKQIN